MCVCVYVFGFYSYVCIFWEKHSFYILNCIIQVINIVTRGLLGVQFSLYEYVYFVSTLHSRLF